MAGTGVSFVRSEMQVLLPIYFMLQDAIEGETAVKGEFGVRAEYYKSSFYRESYARRYLPMPNPTDDSIENKKRYEQYVKRAVYYNFSKRTREGLVGQVFLRPPQVTKPDELAILDKNADGRGLALVQVAKRLVQSALTYGRAGLLADFPKTAGTATVAQAKVDNLQPTLTPYYPWQIVNWATKMVGALRVLSLVVLEEYIVKEVDNFAIQTEIQYRALRLDPVSGNYTVEIHQPKKASGSRKRSSETQFEIISTAVPTDHQGKPFQFIPFSFVGSEANDYEPDQPPMYDICSLNIAHYRNSADYEESCFICGQPTPVVSGVSEYWVKNVLGGQIRLGSRGSISLPEGGEAKLLQAQPNTLPYEAMKMKEEQALALGAKLVQNHKTVRTATEVMVDTTSETSTLHNVADNVSAVIEQGLSWCAQFVGASVPAPDAPESADNQPISNKTIQYRLNTEFELTRMNAADRLAIIKMWQSGAIAFQEMRAVLKVDGTASISDDDVAFDLIQEEQAIMVQNMGPVADPFQDVTATAPGNTPPPGPGGVAGPAVTNQKKVATKKAAKNNAAA